MRRTTIVLACAMVAPLAFAQTRTTKTRQATTTQRETTEVVQSSPDVRPVSYVLGRKVRYVDQAGKAIDPRLIRAGTRVHLDFDGAGAVKRVVVVEKE